MKILKNALGETYYMTEESKGNACGTEYTEIYLYSEELGEKCGTHYRNAVKGSQPNIWTPYKITDKKLIAYSDYTKTRYFMYDIVK